MTHDDSIRIAILLGTVRTQRESMKAARYIEKIGRSLPNIEMNFIDPLTLTLPDEGEVIKDPQYSRITSEADAFIIVTPEYNHSFPGTLKRMLDSEYDNYFHKPVALVGVSNGSWGGTRVCEALLPVCHRLGMVNIRPELYFPKVNIMFDNTDSIKQEFTEQYEKNTRQLYDELIWFARILKENRG